MQARLMKNLSSAVIVLAGMVVQAWANSPQLSIDRPAMANIHDLVVSIDMIPFSTYPSHESDVFESQFRTDVEAQLSRDGFAILKAYNAGDHSPELTFSVNSSRDDDYPSLVVLQMGLTLRDKVTVSNRRIGRFEDNVVLWEWWDAGGEISIVGREDVSSTIQEWAREAIAAFEKAVKDATALSRRVKGHK